MLATNIILNKPVVVPILEKKQETGRISTFQFSLDGITPVPGQFFMIWVPGIDEIPMSVSSIDIDQKLYEISVAAIGDATKTLCEMEVGDLIGIRGPYGNGFNLEGKEQEICIVGGGVGMAALRPAITSLVIAQKNIIVINAARTEGELLYHARFDQDLVTGTTYFTSTDDGTCGEQCFGHELLLKLIEDQGMHFDKVYTCGPELMMKQVFLACKNHGIEMEASLERMMRCGNGLCGLCAMDPSGSLVCKDGPVFTLEQLEALSEFGNYKRDFSGKKILF
ncbi:MAG TPA: dihydroorotate dehydrogenase electron transfer subunit [Candidatus Lokiarchaeia archaeon]|nr:dihydroorotate dehydrogenase electron transfer subunit [Candidatus Lokiarchaeia archaeon]